MRTKVIFAIKVTSVEVGRSVPPSSRKDTDHDRGGPKECEGVVDQSLPEIEKGRILRP